MSDHIRHTPSKEALAQEKENDRKREEELDDSNKDSKFSADNFMSFEECRNTYRRLCDEYSQKILKNFSYIAHSEAGLEPYWDEKENKPAKLPLNQHNVSSHRYKHALTQLSLPYNSFFPNQSWSKTLLDIDIFPRDFEAEGGQVTPGERSTQLDDQSDVIEQAFDRLLKCSLWSKHEHLVMVNQMLNYGVGIFYFDDNSSYKYQCLDFTKMKFPSGTKLNPYDWEYLYMSHDKSVQWLTKVSNMKKAPKGWNQNRIKELLNSISEGQAEVSTTPNPLTKIEDLVEGQTNCGDKVCGVRVDLVSCFWKNDDGKISRGIFADNSHGAGGFLYEREVEMDSFDERFSAFFSDETKKEIRQVRGWGMKIHNLCHAYEREFSRMLDHMTQSSTTFLQMDPADAHKKILHLGSLNVGKFEGVSSIGSNLSSIISGLVYIDQKIDQLIFVSGLNKGEMKGEGRGGDLANILLSVEGRVHKAFLSRFIDRYSGHYQKVLARLLKITLKKGKSVLHPEVEAKFKDFIFARGVERETLQIDDNSIDGIPSNWCVVARKPDGTGITPAPFSALERLQPFMSSLPESGLKYVLERVFAEVFNDVDAISQVFPDPSSGRTFADADLQTARAYAEILTAKDSDFDGDDLDISEEIDPRAADSDKFITLPASRLNDHEVFLGVYLDRVDEVVNQFNSRQIGRPTLHIWLFNLVSTAKNHLDILSADNIRGIRPQAKALAERFGKAFNLLRQVESQANSDRAKKLDALQQKLAAQDQSDPETIKANAALITAQAKQADVQRKFVADEFDREDRVADNARANVALRSDTALKAKALLEPTERIPQANVGRPRANDQRGAI